MWRLETPIGISVSTPLSLSVTICLIIAFNSSLSTAYRPFGSNVSTSLCGRGITWIDCTSPTLRAAAAPASVAAFTAPTSPRTITVTRPEPIFSYPTSDTFAAFTIASAASIAPTRPLVSIIPSALFIIISSSNWVYFSSSKWIQSCLGSPFTRGQSGS
ncbi:conserved hypothetical protein [Listeria monocytogenes str. 4b H7858]|nr:conserved hypothetical protein [Listeria monocytogenes str. 4b H7858] [Listeria monocytogenes serotype 4b str. H7858]